MRKLVNFLLTPPLHAIFIAMVSSSSTNLNAGKLRREAEDFEERPRQSFVSRNEGV